MAVLFGKTGELVLLVERRNKLNRRSGWFDLVCFGSKRHYRVKGNCKHTEAVLSAAGKRQNRIKVSPFGKSAKANPTAIPSTAESQAPR